MNIGLIGLGKMGTPIAERLIAAGFRLYVNDLNRQAIEYLQGLEAIPCQTPKEVAQLCSLVITILPNDAAMKQVAYGADGILEGVNEGSLIVDMSSSSPISTKEIGERLSSKGARMVDAPVSGGVIGAKEGTLSIMAGGTLEDVEQVKPIFSILSNRLTYVGKLGSGHAAKALNNMLCAVTLVATSEAVAIGEKLGLQPEKLLEAINTGSGRSHSSEYKLPKMLQGQFEVGFTMDLMLKDLGIAAGMAEHAQVPSMLTNMVQQVWRLAVAQGGGHRDHTAVFQDIEHMANLVKS